MELHPKRVLWPTDFSELSMKGGQYARAFADAFQAELRVIHICQPLMGSSADLPLTLGMMVGVTQDQVLEAARARLKHVIARAFNDTSRVSSDVRIGVPWQEICRYAESEKCELIVLGTHGYTGFRHVLIGSTAERVVQHAPCPVLTVKTTERDFVRS